MMNHSIPEAVKGLTVLTIDGTSVNIQSLWEKRCIVLTFFRHFG